jgi:hypothetical protein
MYFYFLSVITLVSASNINELFRHYDQIDSSANLFEETSGTFNVDISYRGVPLSLVLEHSKIVKPYSQRLTHLQGYVRHISNSQVRLSAKPGQGIVQGIISFGDLVFPPLYIDSSASFGGNSTNALVYSLNDLMPEERVAGGLYRRQSSSVLEELLTNMEDALEPLRKLVQEGQQEVEADNNAIVRNLPEPPVQTEPRTVPETPEVPETEETPSPPSPEKGVCKMALIADAKWIGLHEDFTGGMIIAFSYNN